MSVPRYRYSHNCQAGMLLIGLDDEAYWFQTQDSALKPLSCDAVRGLDPAQAAFRAEAAALVGAWRELCQSAADLLDPEAARQILRDGLEVMRRAMDTGGGTDPAPAVALQPAA
jgi:hypothetical protein